MDGCVHDDGGVRAVLAEPGQVVHAHVMRKWIYEKQTPRRGLRGCLGELRQRMHAVAVVDVDIYHRVACLQLKVAALLTDNKFLRVNSDAGTGTSLHFAD